MSNEGRPLVMIRGEIIVWRLFAFEALFVRRFINSYFLIFRVILITECERFYSFASGYSVILVANAC